MAYKPMYSPSDVEIPAFLNNVRDIDVLGSYSRYQTTEANDLKMAQARRQEEAQQALANIDMEQEEELRDKEIQRILATSGDLEGLSDYRESKAREKANNYMAQKTQVATLEAMRNQPQEMIDFMNNELGYEYSGVQSNPDKKVQNLGGDIYQTSALGDAEKIGETANSRRSASGGGNNNGAYKTPRVLSRPTSDGKIEKVEVTSKEEEERAKSQGFFNSDLIDDKDEFGLRKPSVPVRLEAPSVGDSNKRDLKSLTPEERTNFSVEYIKTAMAEGLSQREAKEKLRQYYLSKGVTLNKLN